MSYFENLTIIMWHICGKMVLPSIYLDLWFSNLSIYASFVLNINRTRQHFFLLIASKIHVGQKLDEEIMVLFYAVSCVCYIKGNLDIYVEIIYLKYIVKYLMLFPITNTYAFYSSTITQTLHVFWQLRKILPLQIS